MKKKYNLKSLTQKYRQGNTSAEENAIIESWLLHKLDEEIDLPNTEELIRADERISNTLEKHIHTEQIKRLWSGITVAASIILCFGIGLYYPKAHNGTILTKNNIVPGGNKAFLTLTDGKRIVLSDVKNGQLIQQSGVKIIKTSDGQLVYSISTSAKANKIVKGYNAVETPKGGQYQVNLPDGTKVWLNAASTLKYPTLFATSERKVELIGEAYFEVAKDKMHPFIVMADKQKVKVLGTHFNINSYNDEPAIKTTLLEGAVLVNNIGLSKNTVLKPGEQSINNGGDIEVTKINVQSAIGWIHGDFIFKNQELTTSMRQIARWYDIEIIYEPGAPIQLKIGASVSRANPLSVVLKAMEETGEVKFKIQGRRIFILKK